MPHPASCAPRPCFMGSAVICQGLIQSQQDIVLAFQLIFFSIFQLQLSLRFEARHFLSLSAAGKKRQLCCPFPKAPSLCNAACVQRQTSLQVLCHLLVAWTMWEAFYMSLLFSDRRTKQRQRYGDRKDSNQGFLLFAVQRAKQREFPNAGINETFP